jgi:glycosyltransferase involved in cell wall biosynthesis
MRLLISSYHFDAMPEGICTGRLVRALLDAGCRLTLVTSDEADCSFQHPHLEYARVASPRVPHWVFALLSRLYRAPGSFVLWCRRVAAQSARFQGHDLIYGRSAPISSAEAARLIAARLRRPYWIHYSDPFPAPWVTAGTHLFRRLRNYSRRLLGPAQAITFTTPEALVFQEKCLGLPIAAKSFVLPHVAPLPIWLEPPPAQPPTFAYLGSFYGRRNARALLEGFARHRQSSAASRFVFVGADPATVLPDAERLGLGAAVEVRPRVKDVKPAMAGADVLVALDADFGEPVFMTTKIVEYLMVNRTVLMVSPESSSSARLVRRFPETAILAPGEDPARIASAMTAALKLAGKREDFARRFQGMSDFSAPSVAAQFLAEVARRTAT